MSILILVNNVRNSEEVVTRIVTRVVTRIVTRIVTQIVTQIVTRVVTQIVTRVVPRIPPNAVSSQVGLVTIVKPNSICLSPIQTHNSHSNLQKKLL